jgi:hypothetical protein
MTVGELIHALSHVPLETEVLAMDVQDNAFTITYAEAVKYEDGTVQALLWLKPSDTAA